MKYHVTRARKTLGQWRSVLVGLCLVPTLGVAQNFDISGQTSLGYERGPQIMDDGNTGKSSFENTPVMRNNLTVAQTLASNAKLTYGADFDITGNATTTGETTYETDLSVAFQQQFGENNRWRYRIKAETHRSVTPTQWIYQRERLGLHLRYRHVPTNVTTGEIRIGDRDRNDTGFEGFDQIEYLGTLTHTWRPNTDRLAFAGTVYTESRRADSDSFSYDEYGLRFLARVPLSEATEVTARTQFYQRGYEDAFSTSNDTIREDERFKAVVEVDHDFTEKLSGQFYAGWDDNTSTIDEREYADAVVGFGLTYNWR